MFRRRKRPERQYRHLEGRETQPQTEQPPSGLGAWVYCQAEGCEGMQVPTESITHVVIDTVRKSSPIDTVGKVVTFWANLPANQADCNVLGCGIGIGSNETDDPSVVEFFEQNFEPPILVTLPEVDGVVEPFRQSRPTLG